MTVVNNVPWVTSMRFNALVVAGPWTPIIDSEVTSRWGGTDSSSSPVKPTRSVPLLVSHSYRYGSPTCWGSSQVTMTQPSGPIIHWRTNSGSWWARHTWSMGARIIRVTRTVVSSRRCKCAICAPEYVASSVTTASICSMASRVPSNMPISSNWSISAAELKYEVTVSSAPRVDSSKVKTVRMAGRSSFEVPSAWAKPSSTSKEYGRLTSRNSQYPPDCSPSGPVM